MKNCKNFFVTTYILILFFSSIIIAVSLFAYKEESQTQRLTNDYISIKDSWTTATGEKVDLENLHLVEGACEGAYVSIYFQLPDNLNEKNTLYFFARHLYAQVLVDGQMIYEPYYPENILFLKSSGHYRNYVVFEQDISGKVLELRYMCPYDNARCCITDIFIGSGPGMIMSIISSNLIAFITCILLLFVGIVFVLGDVPNNIINKNNHELFYLGLSAITIAVWCMAETHLLQMFTGNARGVHLISCLTLALIPMPILLYVNEAFNVTKKTIFSILCATSIIQFVVCLALNITGIRDLKETLISTHILIVLTFFYIIYTIVKFLIRSHKKRDNIFTSCRIFGLIVLCVTALIDLYRFYRVVGADCAMFVRIGLLIFIVCYGIAGLEQTIIAIQRGAKAELISQLAYQDGLTGLENRTAFQEYLDKLTLKKYSYGIIIFDLNNLKTINDTLGHPAGDKFIREIAVQIEKAFSMARKFRIGGDEFAVIIENETKDSIEGYIHGFEDMICEQNEHRQLPYKLSVAQGMALSDEQKKR